MTSSSGMVYVKWFPRDDMLDSGVNRCSLTAQGLWKQMLNRMMISPRPGFLLTGSGEQMTADDLAWDLRVKVAVIEKLVKELENNRVFSRDGFGTIYSRRLCRDFKTYEEHVNQLRENGKKGAVHGTKGAEHGHKGGRPKTPQQGGYEPPMRGDTNPPITPHESESESESDSESDSHSDKTADAAVPGVSVVEASPTSGEEKSEDLSLAERCAACRPEYARNREGFFAVIRSFTGPDRTITPEELEEVIDEWCLDQANAQDPAKVPTKWLRKAISDAEVEVAVARPDYPQKKEIARTLVFSSRPSVDEVDDPRAAAAAAKGGAA